MSSISRNAPCPCGSGKKYKRCCFGELPDDAGEFDSQVNFETAFDEALYLLTSGNFEEGKDRIEELSKRYPCSPYTHFARGTMFALQEDYDAAIGSFDEAIRLSPNYIEAYFNKAVAFKELLDVKNAIKTFQEVVKRGRLDDEVVVNAKDFLKKMAKDIQGQEGIDLDAYIKGHEIFDKAFLRMEKREWEKAFEGFKKCLEINKNHHQSYGNMGLCLAMLGRKEESLKALDMALAIEPSYAPAISNRTVVEKLKEGERISEDKFISMDYSKEIFLRDRSSSRG